MGSPWTTHPSWNLVDAASEATGRDVSRLLLDADADELTETKNSQLATFVMSMIILDATVEAGVEAELTAGHSLGEFSALVASGAITFDDGCRLVLERGEAMQEAAQERTGTMYAVLGLEDDQVEVACRRADGDVWVANYNAPGQVVIAGDPDALEKAGTIAKQLGAKRAVPLPVGGAFHTAFMASARPRLRKVLESVSFSDPELPIVANVDAMVHAVGAHWPDLCSAQLCSPVRWRHSVDQLRAMEATHLVEVGPGNVLTNLAKRISGDIKTSAVSSPEDLEQLCTRLSQQSVTLPAPTEGEHLHINERLIVSTGSGLFSPVGPPHGAAFGEEIEVGAVIGTVGSTEVRSAFAGKLMGPMVIEGERVTTGQPVAWLRITAESGQ